MIRLGARDYLGLSQLGTNKFEIKASTEDYHQKVSTGRTSQSSLFVKMPQSSTPPHYKARWSRCEHKELLEDIIERGGLRNLSLGNLIKEKPEVYGDPVLDPHQKRRTQNKVNEFKNFPKNYERLQVEILGEILDHVTTTPSVVESSPATRSQQPKQEQSPRPPPRILTTTKTMSTITIDAKTPENHGGIVNIFSFINHIYEEPNTHPAKKILVDGYNLVIWGDYRYYKEGWYKMELKDENTIVATLPSLPYDYLFDFHRQEAFAKKLGIPGVIIQEQITQRGWILDKKERHTRTIHFVAPKNIKLTKKVFDNATGATSYGVIPSRPTSYAENLVRIDWIVSFVEDKERLATNYRLAVNREKTHEELLAEAEALLKGMSFD